MQILGEEINLKANLLFSVKHYLVWWLVLLVTIVFDYLTTLYFVDKFGSDNEANYVVRWLIENMGLLIGTFIGKLLQFLSVILIVSLNRKLGGLFLLLVILLNCWAVVLNSAY